MLCYIPDMFLPDDWVLSTTRSLGERRSGRRGQDSRLIASRYRDGNDSKISTRRLTTGKPKHNTYSRRGKCGELKLYFTNSSEDEKQKSWIAMWSDVRQLHYVK